MSYVKLLVEALPFTNMNRFTIEERGKISKSHGKNGEYFVSTFLALRGDFGGHNRPTQPTNAR